MWYPASDDIKIVDAEYDRVIVVSHGGYVSLVRFGVSTLPFGLFVMPNGTVRRYFYSGLR